MTDQDIPVGASNSALSRELSIRPHIIPGGSFRARRKALKIERSPAIPPGFPGNPLEPIGRTFSPPRYYGERRWAYFEDDVALPDKWDLAFRSFLD